MNESDELQKLRNYFYYLIARRDYSKFELEQKAKLKKYSAKSVDKIVTEFTQSKCIDDMRIAENIINWYTGQKGRKWFEKKFFEKGISQVDYQGLLDEASLEVSAKLKSTVQSKYGLIKLKNLENTEKNKIIRYLSYRGFENPYEILEKWENQ